MPRKARIKSSQNIYHVMLRGINKQQIFYDDEDCNCFMEILRHVGVKSGMELHAYCLMGNHVHLLIRETAEPLETIFRRIGASFVYWYNLKYDRVGHLFQDRFRSEPIEEKSYYFTVLRYILYNPVKAGLCDRPEDYAYSSANEYLNGAPGITKTDYAYSAAGEADLRSFLSKMTDDTCMDVSENNVHYLTDARACQLIKAEFGTITPSPGAIKDRAKFNKSVRQLLRAGISIRQLSRLSGISKKVIENTK